MTIKLHRTKRVVSLWKVHHPCMTCWSDHEHGILLKQLHWQSAVHMIFSCISNSSISVHKIITKKKIWKWKKNFTAHYSLVKKKIKEKFISDYKTDMPVYFYTFITSCAVIPPITPCIGQMSPLALYANCVNKPSSTSSTWMIQKNTMQGEKKQWINWLTW